MTRHGTHSDGALELDPAQTGARAMIYAGGGGLEDPGESVREKLCDVLFRVATTEVLVIVTTAADFTEKLALVDPAVTVTDDAIVIAERGVPSFREITAPPAGAACVKVTVHVALAGVTIVAGVHESVLTVSGLRATEALAELPLSVATTTAVAAIATVPA